MTLGFIIGTIGALIIIGLVLYWIDGLNLQPFILRTIHVIVAIFIVLWLLNIFGFSPVRLR